MPANDFQLHDEASAAPASAAILRQVQAGWGFVPNVHRILAESPAVLEAYQALWTIAERTSLNPVERNIVYLAIIYENRCRYCMAGHSKMSLAAKVAEDEIAAIREGRPLRDAKLETLRRFAASVTKNRGVVADADIAALKNAGYTNQTILDVLVLAAAKLISNYTNHLAQTPLDEFMHGSEWVPPEF